MAVKGKSKTNLQKFAIVDILGWIFFVKIGLRVSKLKNPVPTGRIFFLPELGLQFVCLIKHINFFFIDLLLPQG